MSDHPHVLVATLGGQPQVVTFTLDLLLRRGFPISEVIVIHPRATSPSRLYHSLLHLSAEFTGNWYQADQRPMRFHSYVLELDGKPIHDIIDDTHADGTLNTIHRLISDLKRQRYRVHLSVTGGRRLMSLLAISVAALNFDRHDHIWHLYTPESLLEQVHEGARMHVSPDMGVKLIQGPFIALNASYIHASTLSFRSAEEEQRTRLEAQERVRCREVEQQATQTQLKVLHSFARGFRPQQVAEEFSVSLTTINNHKSALLAYCRNAWGIPPQERLDYHFLRAKFGDYF